MKLTFKDLKQQKFTIDAEPTDKIADIKRKISEEKGWDAAVQKFIYSGKILADENTVESYNIEEKGFIVCMLTKPKPAASAASSSKAPSTPAPAPVQTPSAPAAAASTTSTSEQPPATPSPAPATAATTQASEPPRFDNPSQIAMGSQRQQVIDGLVGMGFERSDAERALRAAFYNADRAVEYLINGIPESAQQQDPPARQIPTSPPPAAGTTGTTPSQTAGTSAPADPDAPVDLFQAAAQQGTRGSTGARTTVPAAGTTAATGGAAGATGNDLSFLRENPQFQQLRQVVQQQPAMLENILQQVAAGNPQLAQLIASSPDQFLHLLSEGDDGEGTHLPPGAQAISVTAEEQEAIERLCRLGFHRDLVIQAYFACDKNEELTANFLFEHPDDADDQ